MSERYFLGAYVAVHGVHGAAGAVLQEKEMSDLCSEAPQLCPLERFLPHMSQEVKIFFLNILIQL